MTETLVPGEEFLAHFGVKGMRWGKRKAGLSAEEVIAKVTSDPQPKDIFSPASPGDTPANSGYTMKGNPYQGFTARDKSYAYIKFTNGEKTVWLTGVEKPILMAEKAYHDDMSGEEFLSHYGVKGQKWGVRRDERALGDADRALNISQRTQVKVASTISALAAVGMSTNAAATLFQLQGRWENLQVVNAVIEKAENNPLVSEAGKTALQQTKSNIIKGIVGSAMATTAVSLAIGVATKRTAKAYFAPMHKVYGDVKPKINSDLRKLSKDIKSGKRPKMTVKDYNLEVARIVEKHMTSGKSGLISPFHQLAQTQLGTQYNTKKLDIKFEKLPNTDLMNKMTIKTPNGLKLVKTIKKVEHSDLFEDGELVGDVDLFFDYKFDADGYISEWSCPTLEVAHDLFEDQFDMTAITAKYGNEEELSMTNSSAADFLTHLGVVDDVDDPAGDFLAHFGVKGMRWGFRRSQSQLDSGAPATAGNASGVAPKGGVTVLGSNGKPLAGAARDAALRKALDGKDTGGTADDAKVVKPPGLSADAARAAILSQQARELGLNTLSTSQLKDLSGRLDAEKKYHTGLMERDKAFAEFNKKPPSKKQKAIDFALDVARDAAISKVTGSNPKTAPVLVFNSLLASSKAKQADLAAQADLRSQAVNQERVNRQRLAPNGTKRSRSYSRSKKQSRQRSRTQRDYYRQMGLNPDGNPLSSYRSVDDNGNIVN